MNTLPGGNVPSPPTRVSPFGMVFSTPAGAAGIISFTVFLLIVFASNAILNSATPRTLGIIVSLSLIGFLFFIIIILFLL